MRTLFDGPVPVDYGQAYVIGRGLLDMQAAFAGQVNGLCGAGEPGGLFLMTGTHSGHVRFTIELHDAEPPPAGPEWQEVVEVPFRPRSASVDLVPWGDGPLAALPLTPDGKDTGGLLAYRVRYCATNMDEGHNPFGSFNPDEIAEGDFTYMNQRPDRYLLLFWPEGPADKPSTSVRPEDRLAGDEVSEVVPPSSGRPGGDSFGGEPAMGELAGGGRTADVIVRQTSRSAASWHAWAAALPAPLSWEEQAEAEDREWGERRRRDKERRQQAELQRWGGRLPNDRLRHLGGNVPSFARMDRELVDGVAAADDAAQRRIAVWAARHAFTHAGIADLDWLAPAWTALENGDPLPAEFTNPRAMLARIQGEPDVTVSISSLRPRSRSGGSLTSLGAVINAPVDPVPMALPALVGAAARDSLQAALEALWAAIMAYGARHPIFRAEVRQAFPTIDQNSPS